MKMIDDVIIIGIDSGYGNIKTANCCFPASLSAYDREPVFKENLLVYESKFYLIGEGHKEFLADKTKDLDYYVLALAAIARELNMPLPPTACRMCSAAGTMCPRICSALTDFPKASLPWMPAV